MSATYLIVVTFNSCINSTPFPEQTTVLPKAGYVGHLIRMKSDFEIRGITNGSAWGKEFLRLGVIRQRRMPFSTLDSTLHGMLVVIFARKEIDGS